MKMSKAKALLFDLGGVVIDIHPSRIAERWAQHAKCSLSELNWSFTPDEAYFRYECGKISFQEYLSLLRARMNISISDAEMLDGWNNIFGDVIVGVPDLLRAAKNHFPLYAFSNSNVAHERCWSVRYEEVLKNFSEIFVSSTIGLRKPDREAFAYVSRRIGLRPEDIAFFDDSPENVEGATAFGLRAYLIRTPRDLAAAVHDVLPVQE
jgi:FMN phosphatase YigB (HAD superfamily)